MSWPEYATEFWRKTTDIPIYFQVAQLIGIKTIINEFAAYEKLGEWTRECTLPNGDWKDDCPYISFRSQNIASFGR